MPAIWTPRDDAPGVEVCRSGHEIEQRGYAAPHLMTRVVDADQRLMDFVLSSGAIDSHRTIVRTKGLNLARIRSYMPWLAFHDTYSFAAGRVIAGRNVTNHADPSKHQTEVRVRFAGDAQKNAVAETMWLMYADEFMADCSAGFVPTERKERTLDGGEVILEYTRSVLMEGSGVNIGSNPDSKAKRDHIKEIARAHMSGAELEAFVRAVTWTGTYDAPKRAADPDTIAPYLADCDEQDYRSVGDWDAPVGGRVQAEIRTTASSSSDASPASPSTPPAVSQDPAPGPESSGAEGRSLPPDSEAPLDAVPAEEERRLREELRANPPTIGEPLVLPPTSILDEIRSLIAASEERIGARIDSALAELWGDEQDRLYPDTTTTRTHDGPRDPAPAPEVRQPPAEPRMNMTVAEVEAFAARAADLALKRHRGEIAI